jgi:hypothetical protein
MPDQKHMAEPLRPTPDSAPEFRSPKPPSKLNRLIDGLKQRATEIGDVAAPRTLIDSFVGERAIVALAPSIGQFDIDSLNAFTSTTVAWLREKGFEVAQTDITDAGLDNRGSMTFPTIALGRETVGRKVTTTELDVDDFVHHDAEPEIKPITRELEIRIVPSDQVAEASIVRNSDNTKLLHDPFSIRRDEIRRFQESSSQS